MCDFGLCPSPAALRGNCTSYTGADAAVIASLSPLIVTYRVLRIFVCVCVLNYFSEEVLAALRTETVLSNAVEISIPASAVASTVGRL